MKIPSRLWIKILSLLWIWCEVVAVTHLSQDVTILGADISLLQDEDDPKCFTKTEEDFTCFFETTDNGIYDMFYSIGESRQSGDKRCDMLTQRKKEGMFLHICSFPYLDVISYVDIHLHVVERNANTSIYSRIVSVEDHILLNAPLNVSLHHDGKAGQLRVKCFTNVPKYWEEKLRYRIGYTSKGLEERIKEGSGKGDDSLVSVVPGEEVQIRVAVKCGNIESAGHWSHWSNPVRDVAPQSADDISLKCYTSDLQMITCRWNSSKYSQPNACRFFSKIHISESLGWTDWTECLHDGNLTDQCSFQGDEYKKVKVKLTIAAIPLTRTFYTQEFLLKNIIKTYPPAHLRGSLEKDKLCLKWEAPLMTLSSHLKYEVGCQFKNSKAWLVISPKGSATDACLEAPPSIKYKVKVRTKPNGSIYSGHWSEWSDVLTGKTPTDLDTLLMICIPATLLITTVVLISLGFTYFRKLKQCFWPPVPNLDKVLQGFLAEMNLQKWDPPDTAKQYCEEATSSVVEVMSQDEVSGLAKACEEFSQLLSSEQGHHTGDQQEGNPRTELKLFPDYVTLNRESVTICSTGNKYVCEQLGDKIRDPGVQGEILSKTRHCFCTDDSVHIPDCFDTNLLNHSYLPLSEPVFGVHEKYTCPRGPGNLYTNLTCS
ncbi:thrombopoietin receptor isoform X2 [Corythoichthys intestinalis]|uniref:thrombopoietin receptor isoform X2 n=1 Tax=Corythoichthys intestinalis TaxID=161448 RepID=UPI0025A60ACF|nr:thrombopoietin receptor isoform X2 [Corythoichthys intestinalis]